MALQIFNASTAHEKLAPLVREIGYQRKVRAKTLGSAGSFAEYETRLLPKELLRQKLHEWRVMLERGEGESE